MIKFKLSNRDEKTKVRTGILKSKQKTSSTPNRLLVSTELNYPDSVKDVVKDIEYPNNLVLAQIRIDAKCLWTRDSDYYNSVIKQGQRYTSQIVDKTCIFKPLLGVYRREKQKDGRYKKVFRTLHNLNLDLDNEQIQKIVRGIVQMTDDMDCDALSLPYIYKLFRLKELFKNLKIAQDCALNNLSSGIEIMPQLPHTNNVYDFEKALFDFEDRFKEGIICIPYRSPIAYRYTHNIIKDFSEKDESEKIGLMCINALRKHPSREVSHPHYTLLQGYDFVARNIPIPFIRKDGKTSHEKKIEEIDKFNKDKLSIEPFNKGLLFDESKVNTACPYFSKFTNKELFRDTLKENEMDTVLKIMETFDSNNEMETCQPYIVDSDFKTYLKVKESLHNAYKSDFAFKQRGLGDFSKAL